MRGMTVKTIVVENLLVETNIHYLMAIGAFPVRLLNVRVMTHITLGIRVSATGERDIDRLNVVTL
jgi:hypothetical protein